MPQLDKVTFLSQFFWLCFFFLLFYFLILKFFLPKMNLILKLRKNKLNGSIDNVNSLTSENQKIYNNYEKLFNNALINSKKNFSLKYNLIKVWYKTNIDNTEKKHYASLNKNYINTVANLSLSENLCFNLIETKTNNSIFVFSLLKSIQKNLKTK